MDVTLLDGILQILGTLGCMVGNCSVLEELVMGLPSPKELVMELLLYEFLMRVVIDPGLKGDHCGSH